MNNLLTQLKGLVFAIFMYSEEFPKASYDAIRFELIQK